MAGRAGVPELGVSVLPERGTCWGCSHTEARRLPILETPKEEQFFCDQCRDEIRAPPQATRSRRPKQPASRVAKHSAGGWSHSPDCSVAAPPLEPFTRALAERPTTTRSRPYPQFRPSRPCPAPEPDPHPRSPSASAAAAASP